MEKARIRLDYNGMMSENVGKNGITPEELEANKPLYEKAAAAMRVQP